MLVCNAHLVMQSKQNTCGHRSTVPQAATSDNNSQQMPHLSASASALPRGARVSPAALYACMPASCSATVAASVDTALLALLLLLLAAALVEATPRPPPPPGEARDEAE